ncbi:hypothetical protein GLP21_18505 [Photobacterium carnosum]|uniref:Uncharacterized protein n=1 Tax=Photobacterium carnosum TaxID=2023717 RepID=A0A2N4UWL7_9GAMM|nr:MULTISPECIES: hypothetical protein [Photobacterium]MCD9476341.1 hypothetical protein [Photobacterium phosphoreum]MCD9488890.1 hypothetical protein [Photobacterium iliopiscarium]MCD9508116.1 hypothetical protein [Photobacterium phosphoreum]MCD9539327.1 hypothetical protein [Photobacterium carnosum]MCD9542309.1 hypothetical protein [Photobacterium carnosum]
MSSVMFELAKQVGGKTHFYESYENESGSLKKSIFFSSMNTKRFVVTEQRYNNIRRFLGVEDVSEYSLSDLKISVKRSLLN